MIQKLFNSKSSLHGGNVHKIHILHNQILNRTLTIVSTTHALQLVRQSH